MDSTTSDEGISRCRVRQRGSNSSINVGDRSRIAALSSDHLGCKQEVVSSSPIASIKLLEVRTLREWPEQIPHVSPLRVALQIGSLAVGVTSVGDRSNRDRSCIIVDEIKNSETASACRVRRL